MNFNVNFDHDQKILFVRFNGNLNYDNLIDAIGRLLGDPDVDRTYDAIFDTRGAFLNLSYHDFIRLRSWLETQKIPGPRARRAIIADSNMNYGTSRMWQGLSEDFYKCLQVFRDEKDALDWLQNCSSE